MTIAKHRTSVVARAALAVTSVGLAAAGVLAGLAVQVPAPAAVVAPVTTPALVPVAAPAVVTPVPRVVTPTVAPTTRPAPSTTTRTTTHYTEDELRERAKTITTDDLRDGRGSMPDGGLTSGETQLVYGCEQGYIPASECD